MLYKADFTIKMRASDHITLTPTIGLIKNLLFSYQNNSISTW